MLGRWLDKQNSFAGSQGAQGAGGRCLADAAQAGSASSSAGVESGSGGAGSWAESFRLDHAELIGPHRPGPRIPGSLTWLLATTSILSALVFGLVVETTRSVGAREARQSEDGHRVALQQAEDRIATLALELRSEKDAAEISRSLLSRQLDEGSRALETVEADLKRAQSERQAQAARADDREQALRRLEEQFEASRREASTLRSEAADLLARTDAAMRAQAAADEARRAAEAVLANAGGARDGDAPARTELASIDDDARSDVRSAALPVAMDRSVEAAPLAVPPVADPRPGWLTHGSATFASLDAVTHSRGLGPLKAQPQPTASAVRRAPPRPNRGRPQASDAVSMPASPAAQPVAKGGLDDGEAGPGPDGAPQRVPVSALLRPSPVRAAPQQKPARGEGVSAEKKLSNPK